MKIRTEFVCPPIPSRCFDWLAVDDDTETQAYGATKQEAIENLLEEIENKD